MSNTLTIQSQSAFSVTGGTMNVGPDLYTGASTAQWVTTTITSTGVTVTCPSFSFVGFKIIPPTTNAYTIKFKMVTGDQGLFIPQSTPSYFFCDPANLPASFFLVSGTTTVGLTSILFF